VRIFLDANILFSAAKSDGAVRQLLRMLVEAQHVLCADAYVAAEAARNLNRKGPEALDAFEALIGTIEIVPFQVGKLNPETARMLPEKDRPVLAAAIRLECEVLLTGDRTHFGSLYGRSLQGVTIYSPQLLVERLFG